MNVGEILDRTIGRPIRADVAERIEALEATVQKLETARSKAKSLPDELHGAAAVELEKRELPSIPA